MITPNKPGVLGGPHEKRLLQKVMQTRQGFLSLSRYIDKEFSRCFFTLESKLKLQGLRSRYTEST